MPEEFTKGKWKVGINEKYGPYVYADTNEEIIAVMRGYGIVDETVRQANARLIAAAPEMYEILKAFAYPGYHDNTVTEIIRLCAKKLLARINGKEEKA